MDVVLTNCTAGVENIESDFTNCSSDHSDDEVVPIDEIVEEYEEFLMKPDEERETRVNAAFYRLCSFTWQLLS